MASLFDSAWGGLIEASLEQRQSRDWGEQKEDGAGADQHGMLLQSRVRSRNTLLLT
jgi:hypothetical protein